MIDNTPKGWLLKLLMDLFLRTFCGTLCITDFNWPIISRIQLAVTKKLGFCHMFNYVNLQNVYLLI